jgi:sec-independent protein translocase protein TatA
MDLFSPSHLLIVLAIVFLLFGAKRVPEIGASFGKGIREFKRGIGGDAGPPNDTRPSDPPARVSERSDNAPEPKRLLGDMDNSGR